MFLKKYFYKFFDKKRYKNEKILEKIKLYTRTFKAEFEPYIEEIQKKIQKNHVLTFLHSGTSGDLINALPVIKELSKDHECNLYIQTNKSYKLIHKDNYGKVLLNENSFNMLMPLLKEQKYINKVMKFNNQEIDINFDRFRDLPISFLFDNLRYYFNLTGVQPDILESYINVKPHDIIKNKIVILRTLRYQNHFINYKFLENYKDLLFVGTKNEYEDLQKDVKNLEFHDCKDFLEMAMIMKSSKFFIGNSSIGHALAEGIKVPRLLEASPLFPAAQPHGKNAYDFYYQIHFKKFFKKLYENY